ncbi:MAG: SAM-dependent methyltransferase [Zetaproteobacteria bacterium CG_4_9_14_3_um_filter_49_83]|nr:MAG: SAM-dependent methyltransferase [Zetaproteobacteria bacterium CG1_02_49_23]PIQ33889.1 MAG: SAM-dependent methyltransferase [Zetaproteobacteria bacterium CG17_big_fil_post_rev_8_21_14_2_50_50_13]PIV30680.1 MAG: SAM-dependent methyltransferase [Zetaproteobacteria bacterium CG02_land_8_20_14_3_00_50_9]PIY55825.1 MAG: SAM-dependent methyltransferase [Zetaproteobacteria bacterium CG_4_10_14_0_8_um_filter_49_80]PJA36233.1 MAG: SAM-dependent methyltransferase [Zetaproteobacteria bacterium CG_4
MSWEQAVQWLRDQPDQQELVRACYFDDPLNEAAERFWQSAEWKAIAALLPPPQGKALDLGAGRGISSYAMARDGWLVTALEPDPSELVGAGAIRSLAEQSDLPITVVSEYSEKLPFHDNSFDVVNCRQVLHHARDLQQTCREIFRVIKPGGVMVASREHVISKREDMQAFLDSHPLHKFYGGENAFLLDEYLSAMQLAGLHVHKALAPLDSPINYFPMTTEQHFTYCTGPTAGLIGKSMSNFLFSQDHVFGRALMKILVSALNYRDQTPGRLYSFVGVKPLAEGQD